MIQFTKKIKILVHTITFNIIVFNQQKLKKAGAALVITVTSYLKTWFNKGSGKQPPFASDHQGLTFWVVALIREVRMQFPLRSNYCAIVSKIHVLGNYSAFLMVRLQAVIQSAYPQTIIN